jgi:hypothetical protein
MTLCEKRPRSDRLGAALRPYNTQSYGEKQQFYGIFYSLLRTSFTGTARLFLLSMTIHVTYTLLGGFLCGVTCATAKTVTVVTNCVAQELARPAAKGNLSDRLDGLSVYNKCLECVFSSRHDYLIDPKCMAWISH